DDANNISKSYNKESKFSGLVPSIAMVIIKNENYNLKQQIRLKTIITISEGNDEVHKLIFAIWFNPFV
ncbi:MAG: hypothetical protein OQK04_04795, partial [Kangiellaceae bacterium]|nr:hypothetical protein [Kangiellaceae bacterium]